MGKSDGVPRITLCAACAKQSVPASPSAAPLPIQPAIPDQTSAAPAPVQPPIPIQAVVAPILIQPPIPIQPGGAPVPIQPVVQAQAGAPATRVGVVVKTRPSAPRLEPAAPAAQAPAAASVLAPAAPPPGTSDKAIAKAPRRAGRARAGAHRQTSQTRLYVGVAIGLAALGGFLGGAALLRGDSRSGVRKDTLPVPQPKTPPKTAASEPVPAPKAAVPAPAAPGMAPGKGAEATPGSKALAQPAQPSSVAKGLERGADGKPEAAPADAIAKASEPTAEVKPEAAPAAAPYTPAEFAKDLKQAEALAEAARYSAATKLLDDLKALHGQAGWWPEQEKNWRQTRTLLDAQYKEYREEAREAVEALRKEQAPEAVRTAEAAWRPRAESGDALAAPPAREVLDLIVRLRLKHSEAALAKQVQEAGARMEQYEKLLKARVPGKALEAKALEPVLAFVREFEAQAANRPDLGPLAARFAALRFDAQMARETELSLLGGTLKWAGADAELRYDFKTPAHFQAWAWDRPGGGGENTATHDQAKGVAVIRSTDDHAWEGQDRKSMGVLRIPCVSRFDTWTFEAEVAEIGHKEKAHPPDMGILVWDGGHGVLRFGIREGPAASASRNTRLYVAGCLGKMDSYSREVGQLACNVTDTVRLTMLQRQGALSFTATVVGLEQTVAGNTVLNLPFPPKWFGLYLRTRQKKEESSAVFGNVRFTFRPDTEALRALAAARREALVGQIKVEAPEGK
jgi:hypothetical protein